jgi:hypothetical protein
MSIAVSRFEWVRRDIVMAIRWLDGVTGTPLRVAVDMELLGAPASALCWFAKRDGTLIIESAPPGPLDLILHPRSPAYAPRRALIQRFPAPAPGEPDPRGRAVDVQLTPSVSYPASANTTQFVCRVVRDADKAVVPHALVRLLRAGASAPVASAVTNSAGEALLIGADIPLFNSNSTTISRVSTFRLEASVSRSPLGGLPLDPDALAAVISDSARAITAGRSLDLVGGQRNPTVTLELAMDP